MHRYEPMGDCAAVAPSNTGMATGGLYARIVNFVAGLAVRAAERRRQTRLRWLRHTTEREIAALSPQLRKDIGWPSRYEC